MIKEEITNNFLPKAPYRYNVGEIVNGMKVLKQTYSESHDGKRKAYLLQCETDNEIFIKREDYLNKHGCPICANKVVIKGVNDIATTHPDIVKYFKNPEDANKFSYGSTKKIQTKCPFCGMDGKIYDLNRLSMKGFSCGFCGDGTSCSEKFFIHFFMYLNIEFVTQLSNKYLPWCKKYRYDFYLPKFNTIIEINGRQHYEESFSSFSKARTLDEEILNDKNKYELAINNGISNYIVIDCRKTDINWIKKSILNSELVNLLNININNIDWNKIYKDSKNAKNSMFFDICYKWNNNKNLTTTDISKIFNIDVNVVQNYLKNGNKIGICNYSKEEGYKRSSLKISGENSKASKCVLFNNTIYKCSKDFAKSINKSYSTVNTWLRGVNKPVGKNYIYREAHYATKEEINKYQNDNK